LDKVITYYLEMNRFEELKEVPASNGLSVAEAEIDNFRFNKFLYQYVGEPWQWVDKLGLSDETWQKYAENPGLRTWVAYFKGSIAGYFELSIVGRGDASKGQCVESLDVEIMYFGLAAEFIGKGFGGYLLSRAVQEAWGIPGVKRVWLHTCSLDHPSALKNYEARGFRRYKQEES